MAWFKANFFDQKGFFYPGETVAGQISVTLRSDLEFSKLALVFLGESRARWAEGDNQFDDIYSGSQTYFKENSTLLSPSNGRETMKLEAGEYSYPFSFQLPATTASLPPSFDLSKYGTVGQVRYYMKVGFEVEDYRLRLELREELPFKVLPIPVDLNEKPELLEPIGQTKEKFLCCLCCRSGPIRFNCQVSKQIFQPGESLEFNFELDNTTTNQELRKAEARIVEETTLIHANTRTFVNHRTIASVVITTSLHGGMQECWQNLHLKIPEETAPTFTNCTCVHVAYKFQVEVDIPSAIDTKLEFQITIVNALQSSQLMANPPMVAAGSQLSGLSSGASVDQSVYLPLPVTMQPGTSIDETVPDQPPPAYNDI